MSGSAGFVGVAALLTLLLLAFSHATTTALTGDDVDSSDRDAPDSSPSAAEPGIGSHPSPPTSDGPGPGSHPLERARASVERDLAPDLDRPGDGERSGHRSAGGPASDDRGDDELAALSTGALLANVAVSQGLLGAVLVGAAVYMEVPAVALGIGFTREYLLVGLAFGTAVGLGLYVANELGAAGATRFGIAHDDGLRESLSPDGLVGWAVLLGLVLPIIAGFEELLFRAALIGAVEAGFGVSPWLLAVVSSIAFALGHGMQGPAGILVTGALGLALATAFVLTGSLLVVVVAHYLVNALELVVHEGLGLEWTERWERDETTGS